MGEFIRDRLPEPRSYYTDTAGLQLVGAPKSKWVTTRCEFHDGSDSMRIFLPRGSFICMACGAKGGDVLSYHMALHGLGFVEAAKALGAYQDDGKDHRGGIRPHPIAAHVLLASVAYELTVATVITSDVVNGAPVSTDDLERLTKAAARILYVAEAANGK
jgi:CHC2 zinc finger